MNREKDSIAIKKAQAFPTISLIDIWTLGLVESLGTQFSERTRTGGIRLMEKSNYS